MPAAAAFRAALEVGRSHGSAGVMLAHASDRPVRVRHSRLNRTGFRGDRIDGVQAASIAVWLADRPRLPGRPRLHAPGRRAAMRRFRMSVSVPGPIQEVTRGRQGTRQQGRRQEAQGWSAADRQEEALVPRPPPGAGGGRGIRGLPGRQITSRPPSRPRGTSAREARARRDAGRRRAHRPRCRCPDGWVDRHVHGRTSGRCRRPRRATGRRHA